MNFYLLIRIHLFHSTFEIVSYFFTFYLFALSSSSSNEKSTEEIQLHTNSLKDSKHSSTVFNPYINVKRKTLR